MQRYFAAFDAKKNIILCDGDVHHFLHVMRGQIDQQIEAVVDGKLYLAKAVSLNPLLFIVQQLLNENVELEQDITLMFALAKGDKIDFVIQKATELGVKRIALINTKRAIVKMDEADFQRKLKRYQSIAKEASEQCHRLVIPEICGIYQLKNLPASIISDVNFVAYENVNQLKPDFVNLNNAKSITYFVGPEGGFEKDEIDFLKTKNFHVVSLGKRILRTETAAVYGLSVLGYLLERR